MGDCLAGAGCLPGRGTRGHDQHLKETVTQLRDWRPQDERETSEARTDCEGPGMGAISQLRATGRTGRHPRNKVSLCSLNQGKSLVRVRAH